MTDVISIAVLAAAILSLLVAMISGIAMLGHLRGGNRELIKVVMHGPFSPREVFTDAGWRHRNRGVRATLAAFIGFALWVAMYVVRQ